MRNILSVESLGFVLQTLKMCHIATCSQSPINREVDTFKNVLDCILLECMLQNWKQAWSQYYLV